MMFKNCVMKFDSVCSECNYCAHDEATSEYSTEESTPESWWCEKNMDNFGLSEGCYKYCGAVKEQ